MKKPSKKMLNKMYALLTKDVGKEVEKAYRDSLVYGTGVLKMNSDGSIYHVPYRKWINEKT